MKTHETIVFIGRSGSGKGTQIKLLQEYLQAKYPDREFFLFGSGSHFRNFINQEGYTSEIMRSILSKGTLAPDFITEWLLVDAMVKNMKEASQIFVLDGFPRTVNQAKTLNSAMDYYGIKNVHIVNIDVSPNEVRKRMLERNRADDKTEYIESRIAWYNENVLPTIEYFREQPDQYQIHEINGEQAIDQVHQEIIKALKV